jgi:hypothetical protein
MRYLALLVLLGTTSAALLDYLFKLEAVRTFGRGDNLLRFFAIYYAATSLITFVVQMSSSRFVLERFGLAMTTSTPSFALLAGSVGGLLAPGLSSMVAARGGETVFRGSLFRAGYELFYTPIPAAEKRAAKSIIDVAFARLGDALGGGMVRAVLLVAPAAQYSAILGLGIACSAGAIAAASRLNRGYIKTLEKSLLNRAVEIDWSDIQDGTSRTLMIQTLGLARPDFGPADADEDTMTGMAAPTAEASRTSPCTKRTSSPSRLARTPDDRLSKTTGFTICFTDLASTSLVLKKPKSTAVISVPIGVDTFILLPHCHQSLSMYSIVE